MPGGVALPARLICRPRPLEQTNALTRRPCEFRFIAHDGAVTASGFGKFLNRSMVSADKPIFLFSMVIRFIKPSRSDYGIITAKGLQFSGATETPLSHVSMRVGVLSLK